MAIMNLPPVPPELKSISPYLQRADEVSSKDPVMSYWCAYYAAQAGISLKLKESTSRKFLFTLLGVLEHLKEDLGHNDAVEDESAAAAYVENFALKVFTMADSEDRRGQATRGTAKKFLAAANFLEILRTFEKDKAESVSADSNAEKIRYSKWKAADIAKAFREGRKPTPGPAGGDPSPEPDVIVPSSASPPPQAYSPPESVAGTSALAPMRTTPPPPSIVDLPSPQQNSFFQQVSPHAPNASLLPHSHPDIAPVARTPGTWSTVTTPGTPGEMLSEDTSPSPSRKEVRFTPSVTGGLTPGFEPSAPPFLDQSLLATPPDVYTSLPSVPSPSAPEPRFSARFVPEDVEPESGASFASQLPPGFVPSIVLPSVPAMPPPPGASDATLTPVPVELTPVVIARAQKHCRFAVSSLDYEDVEQARKELRAALKLLGG
ncbi:hypothetical protein POSPLADRAFT_1042568 [Postia placenta MAD-698-R-SB12]|uniref:Vta1/callose synthase N-terminal domain-containing protein n=1 Tax=Postia placenta MAD-698-R-SB12 TaxID=670580 RepID=A0A1X6NFC2_9APHY|nr:hypothetical protein POSPLADRAFT_1042568 [Postia placenta MAD-698-R-SB12]OSX67335.1 hypothetical protein POSPLADRAFT_1042568 [Postia placenta MAD-698-R-SB12]